MVVFYFTDSRFHFAAVCPFPVAVAGYSSSPEKARNRRFGCRSGVQGAPDFTQTYSSQKQVELMVLQFSKEKEPGQELRERKEEEDALHKSEDSKGR
ncbi:hypothetical protein ANANG_G00052480 [Anguilla anguilla]|uniref:Uncharacterized protein n=1 Tax=Anguilla anguilla TaxID=7936 RepID=A0A9D3MVT1_ANGAN|nr:hypothetical protein ANANG_G00052480 [Anguilla anguilla]